MNIGENVYSKIIMRYNPQNSESFTIYKNSKGTIINCIEGFKNNYYEVQFKNGIAILRDKDLKSTM